MCAPGAAGHRGDQGDSWPRHTAPGAVADLPTRWPCNGMNFTSSGATSAVCGTHPDQDARRLCRGATGARAVSRPQATTARLAGRGPKRHGAHAGGRARTPVSMPAGTWRARSTFRWRSAATACGDSAEFPVVFVCRGGEVARHVNLLPARASRSPPVSRAACWPGRRRSIPK